MFSVKSAKGMTRLPTIQFGWLCQCPRESHRKRTQTVINITRVAFTSKGKKQPSTRNHKYLPVSERNIQLVSPNWNFPIGNIYKTETIFTRLKIFFVQIRFCTKCTSNINFVRISKALATIFCCHKSFAGNAPSVFMEFPCSSP